MPSFLRELPEIIAAQFPDLAPVHVAYLGEGYDSTAFEVNESWVFRFPKRSDIEQQLLIETRVLPVLGSHLPILIPAFSFLGRPTEEFPRHFAGYRKLPGVPGVAPDAPLDAWHRWLSAGSHGDAVQSTSTLLVHNDFAAEHVLCDPGTGMLTGVIDWSDMAVGDPAADLAGVFHWGGEPFAKAVLAHYDGQVDDNCMSRARFMAACRGVGDVRFGLDMNRPEYVAAGIRALQLCAHRRHGGTS